MIVTREALGAVMPRAPLEWWRPIVGYEGWYEVSNLGNVRRIRGAGGRSISRPLKNQLMKTGYLKVDLWRDNIGDPQTVHSLVAKAFLGPRPTPDHEVAHWDGDRTNCRLSNLRWATRKENADDTDRQGRRRKGETHGMAKLTAAQVVEMRRLRRGGMILREIAARFGVNRPHAGEVCRGVLWSHVGGEHADAA